MGRDGDGEIRISTICIQEGVLNDNGRFTSFEMPHCGERRDWTILHSGMKLDKKIGWQGL
jgi:hypothetical protein